MHLEQFLHFTAHLDWRTPDDILGYLDGLGLWPLGTPQAAKVQDITEALLAEDASGTPRVACRQQPDGQWVFKQESACTWADLQALAAFYEAQVEEGKAAATAARDQAVQQGDAHRVLPWEGTPGI